MGKTLAALWLAWLVVGFMGLVWATFGWAAFEFIGLIFGGIIAVCSAAWALHVLFGDIN